MAVQNTQLLDDGVSARHGLVTSGAVKPAQVWRAWLTHCASTGSTLAAATASVTITVTTPLSTTLSIAIATILNSFIIVTTATSTTVASHKRHYARWDFARNGSWGSQRDRSSQAALMVGGELPATHSAASVSVVCCECPPWARYQWCYSYSTGFATQ